MFCNPKAVYIVLAFAFHCTSQAAAQDTGTSKTLVFTGATLIDGSGVEPVENSIVAVQDERIIYAGGADEYDGAANSEVIDVSGKTILPGFFNAHVHKALSEEKLRAWANEGVTTVRLLGSNHEELKRFRDGLTPDPTLARLVAAGPYITVEGGYPSVFFGGRDALHLESETDSRSKIEHLLNDGVDLLKVMVDHGVNSRRELPVPSKEILSITTDLAHEHGTRVSVHLTSAIDVAHVLDTGVDDLSHMSVDRVLTPDEVEAVVDRGIYWGPSLELWDCVGHGFDETALQNLRLFVEAGGKVVLGTDYSGYQCDWQLGMPTREMALMSQAGMSPMEIIVSATQNAAYVSNLENELGTVEPGKTADLLVVSGYPLDDISAVANTHMVVRSGKIIRNEAEENRNQPT